MKYFLLLVTMLTLLACGQDDQENLDTNGGRCALNNSGDTVACIDFSNSTDANDASNLCDSIYTSDGGTYFSGKTYDSGSTNCGNNNVLGTCAVSGGTMKYYSDGSIFNATTAEAHCTASPQSGTWTAAK
jgi:hypothetical protein